MRILLVEDETKLADALAYQLRKNGYAADTASDGDMALAMAREHVYELYILDWMLPKRDGLSVLKEMRAMGVVAPVLLLTARDSLDDRVKGLDAGADDYLTKPFLTEELLARLRALSRRKNKDYVGDLIVAGAWTLDPLKGEARHDGKRVQLSQKEAQLLELLLVNQGQVITKERIFERVWGYCAETELTSVELYIHYLRKKLDTTAIKTARGVGYYWTDEDDHAS